MFKPESKTYAELKEGLKQFSQINYPDKKDLFKALGGSQFPKILFITCSDSRIAPCLITNTDPGDLFVIRNAGNMISMVDGSAEMAAIEFAVKALKVTDVVICGHTNCGAMKAAIADQKPEGLPHVCSWLEHVSDLKEASNGDLDKCIELNVVKQMHNIKKLGFAEHLGLHGWVYNIATGTVSEYDPRAEKFVPINENDKS